MAGFSNPLAKQIFDATLAATASQVSVSTVGDVYVSLHTSAPSDTIGGTDGTELADPASNSYGYARVQVDGASGRPSFTGAEVGDVYRATNSGSITFPAASIDYPAPVTHWAIWKSATLRTTANMLYSGEFTVGRTVLAGDVVVVGAGEMDIDLT